MGAEAIRKLLQQLDVERSRTSSARHRRRPRLRRSRRQGPVKRLKIVEAIRKSDNKPEWMVLDVIPVIPPDLRPLVLLDSGNFATAI